MYDHQAKVIPLFSALILPAWWSRVLKTNVVSVEASVTEWDNLHTQLRDSPCSKLVLPSERKTDTETWRQKQKVKIAMRTSQKKLLSGHEITLHSRLSIMFLLLQACPL